MSSKSTHTKAAALAAAALLFGAAGCPGTLEDPARFMIGGDGGSAGVDAAACGDVTSLLVSRCATAGCHSTADMMSGLDLQSPDIYSRLVGKAATGGPGVLIDPSGSLSASVLYTKLSAPPPFGAQMPLTGAKLDAATIACIGEWIQAGGVSSAGASPGDDGGEPSGDDSSVASGDDSSSGDDASAGDDTSASDDSGSVIDAAVIGKDAGAKRDAGAKSDSGTVVDSGTGVDSSISGVSLDSGAVVDSASGDVDAASDGS